MELEFFPIDVEQYFRNKKACIAIFGRTLDGKKVCVIDEEYKAYFYMAIEKDADARAILKSICEIKIVDPAEGGSYQVANAEIMKKNVLGKETTVIKIEVNDLRGFKRLQDIARRIQGVNAVLDSDITITRKYIIDKDITPLLACVVEGEQADENIDVDIVIMARKISQKGEVLIKDPKILAFDIEVYNKRRYPDEEKDPVVLLAFYGSDGFSRVITWKKFSNPKKYVEFVNDEGELILSFRDVIHEYKPDYLVGYFSDGFDFPYIRARADKFRIKLNVGLDKSEIRLVRRSNSFSVKVRGIAHIDIYKFINRMMGDILDVDSFDLDNVAKALLGEGKTEADINGLADAWDNNNEKLREYADYNLNDARIALRLTNIMLPNLNEIVKLVGQPIYDVCRMSYGQLVEWYLIKQVRNFNELVPRRPLRADAMVRRMQSYEGAFVYQPEPGLYNDIVIFDFRSLYPSIISAHNICPSTLTADVHHSHESPEIEVDGRKETYYFDYQKDGFIPAIIKDIIQRRIRIKEIIKGSEKLDPVLNARQNTLKILANSFYGYLGFPGARWYSKECAASIAAFGREYIKNVIEEAKKNEFKVIYSDSLPYNRHIFIKTPKNEIKTIRIGEFYKSFKPGYETLAMNPADKKTRFMPVRRVIRHHAKKRTKLLELVTTHGATIVTDQHSVYAYNGGVVLAKASALKEGDILISLTNPPCTVKYRTGYTFDFVDLVSENVETLWLYKDNRTFPARRGVCPYCGDNAAILASHVHARHQERRHVLNKQSSFKFIGARNGRSGKIPRYWVLDEDLAWLLGFYCAEGSVSNVQTKTGRKLLLSFGGEDHALIKKVKSILDKRLEANLKIIRNFDHRTKKYMYYYRVQRIPIVDLFQHRFGAGKGSAQKRVPFFIFNSEEALRKAFLRGYLDGDGNKHKDKRYTTKFIRFSTKSKELAIGLQFVLKSLRHGKTYWKKDIKHVAWAYRKDKPGILSLRLQSSNADKGDFCLAKIKEIKKRPYEKFVYDLEVAGAHNFVDAEGMILVHNTDSIFVALQQKTKDDALQFSKRINESLPSLMELELQGFYPRGIFVMKKGESKGAKKKYALIDETGKIKITGFETIRGDWSLIAKEVQQKVFELILKEENVEKAVDYVKDMIKKIEHREIPIESMVIQKQLRKEIGDYDSIGPHVAVAQRMRDLGMYICPGSVVQYVIEEGQGVLRERARLQNEAKNYDVEYYVQNQVIPAVEKIFEVLGHKKEVFIHHDQKNLGDF